MKFRRITPFLWFEGRALDAAKHYCRIFKNARVLNKSSMGATIMLDGQVLHVLNGPRMEAFSSAVSMYVECKDQKEVDYYYSRLLKGGKASRCGWLQDKFGMWWQIIPTVLPQVLNGKDKVGSRRAMEAMMHMVKLDVAKLKAAYRGE